MTPILEDLPFSSGRPGAGLHQRHGRHAAARALPAVRARSPRSPASTGSRSSATWSATTSPRWRCRAASITLLKLDDELLTLLGRAGQHPGAALGHLTVAINRDSTLAWMQPFATAMAEHRQELVRLDTAIGDGDHGTNMDRGMQKAVEKLAGRRAGRPRRGAQDGRDDADLDRRRRRRAAVRDALPAAGQCSRRTARGRPAELRRPPGARLWTASRRAARPSRATRRWSTRCCPAVEALEQASELDAAAWLPLPRRREQGMLATTPLVARKGRASYLGERSAGHQDPGATSTYYLFKSAAGGAGGLS